MKCKIFRYRDINNYCHHKHIAKYTKDKTPCVEEDCPYYKDCVLYVRGRNMECDRKKKMEVKNDGK